MTPTSTPTYKSWTLLACGDNCGGPTPKKFLGCFSSYSKTVYTSPSVTSITDISTVIYENTALTTTWSFGYFEESGFIYEVLNGEPSVLGPTGQLC
jgi:hypothetical protein